MKITITGRHLELDDNIRSHAEKKLHKAETYFDRIIEAHMILSAEKHRRIAEVTLHAKRAQFHAQEETENIFASIDGVMEKIDTQIVKFKEKLKDRKHIREEEISFVETSETSDEEEDEEDTDESEDLKQPEELQIVKVKRFASKPMTAEEAVMQITGTNDDFITFFNSQTKQVNVIYRRKDGSYGWIEPELE
jgi:putative sigma-54 modulation protein